MCLWTSLWKQTRTTISAIGAAPIVGVCCTNTDYHALFRQIKVIAVDAGIKYSFYMPRDVLSVSSVIKDYFDDPSTLPSNVKRNGNASLTFVTGRKVLAEALEYMRRKHDGRKFVLQMSDRDSVFFVQLYKLAVCLGYVFLRIQRAGSKPNLTVLCSLDELGAMALDSLKPKTLELEDFLKASGEAGRLKLDDPKFLKWFIGNVQKREDKLLKRLTEDNDFARLCNILILALARMQDIVRPGDAFTAAAALPTSLTPPSSATSLRHKDTASRETRREPDASPLKRRSETCGPNTKKRRFNATVEDAPEQE